MKLQATLSRQVVVLCIIICLPVTAFCQPLLPQEYTTIENAIKNKKIIGLGEPDHFYEGFYAVKIDLIKHLIQKNLLDAVILEASLSETQKLNRYIQGEEDSDIETILPRLNAGYEYSQVGLYDCRQIAEFLRWLRKENTRRKVKVSIAGIDFQNIKTPVDSLRAYLTAPKLRETIKTLENNLTILLKQFAEDPMQIYFDSAWKKMAGNTFISAQRILSETENKQSLSKAKQYARELNQFAYIFTDPNLQRDSIMYSNFLKIYKPGNRVVIWAASAHIANDSVVNKFSTMHTLGFFLTRDFRKEYLKITLLDPGSGEANRPERIRFLTTGNALKNKYDLVIDAARGEEAKRLGHD